MMEHIIMMKLKDAFNAEQKKEKSFELKDLLLQLPAKISEIKAYEVGINISLSPNAYDLVLNSSFENLKTLELYKNHPEHQKVLQKIKQFAQAITVVDYEKET